METILEELEKLDINETYLEQSVDLEVDILQLANGNNLSEDEILDVNGEKMVVLENLGYGFVKVIRNSNAQYHKVNSKVIMSKSIRDLNRKIRQMDNGKIDDYLANLERINGDLENINSFRIPNIIESIILYDVDLYISIKRLIFESDIFINFPSETKEHWIQYLEEYIEKEYLNKYGVTFY